MILNFAKLFRCQRKVQGQICVSLRKFHQEVVQVTWEKPDFGWTKLNFDGSVRYKTGMGSIGGVLRNHKAEFILGYAESIGKTTSTIAELTALQRGIDLVLENGWYNVWFEGDEKRLLEIIANRIPIGSKEIQRQTGHINSILGELDNYKMTHIYREGNKTADTFAKLGHKLDKPCIWRCSPPKEVLRFVREDAEGKINERIRKKMS
ncbi:Ribonuclease H domain [Macleaya cordata]|uniref:Ribonuclease H domain n=1 Tax=Macleaya cordata TaxID=56857 RepID=A0A200QBZ3_MACCD|nr:Ribonuclease H domain [Macleaya cordata]